MAILEVAAQPVKIAPVVVTGQPATGAGSEATFETFSPPVINNAGRVAFHARLARGGSISEMNDEGIWSGAAGSLSLIAQQGGTAKGKTPFAGFKVPREGDTIIPGLTDSGRVIFLASLGEEQNGIWLSQPGAPPIPVALSGDAAPGMAAGTRFMSVDLFPAFNEAGQIVFRAGIRPLPSITPEEQGTSLWLWDQTRKGTVIAHRRGPVMGATAGMTFTWLEQPDINAKGVITFVAGVGSAADPNPSTRMVALWRGVFPKVQLFELPVVNQNRADYSWRVRMNQAGQAALLAKYAPRPPSRDKLDTLLMLSADGKWNTPVAAGHDAPGVRDMRFARIGEPSLNNTGAIAFTASLAPRVGPLRPLGTASLWSTASGKLLVAGRDDQMGEPFNPLLNDSGRVAFQSWDLKKPPKRRKALWVEVSPGEVVTIAQPGQQIEVAPGDTRIVEEAEMCAGVSERKGRRGWNDAGQLAFKAVFENGTEGIFIATVQGKPPRM